MPAACFLLALSASVDSLSVGILYGIRGIRVPFASRLTISVIAFACTFVGAVAGMWIMELLGGFSAEILGGIILILIGVFLIFQVFTRHDGDSGALARVGKILSDPATGDEDGSKEIDIREAAFIGLALSLDGIGIGMAGSAMGAVSWITSASVALANFVMLTVGCKCAYIIHNRFKINESLCSLLSGTVMIALGMFRIFGC